MMGKPIEGESFQVQVNEETLKKVAEILGIPDSHHDQIHSIYIARRPLDQIRGTSSGGGGSSSSGSTP
jgi:hypothetical protein